MQKENCFFYFRVKAARLQRKQLFVYVSNSVSECKVFSDFFLGCNLLDAQEVKRFFVGSSNGM